MMAPSGQIGPRGMQARKDGQRMRDAVLALMHGYFPGALRPVEPIACSVGTLQKVALKSAMQRWNIHWKVKRHRGAGCLMLHKAPFADSAGKPFRLEPALLGHDRQFKPVPFGCCSRPLA